MIVFSSIFAVIISFALPIIATCLVVLLQPWFSASASSGVKKYLSYIFHTPSIKSMKNSEVIPTLKEKKNYLKTQLLSRLGLVYIFLFLFLASNMVAEFYYIMGDLIQPISQGGTDLVRTWTAVEIDSPFYGGWEGSLPWYGSFVLPALEANTFHEPWNWRLFTAAISTNESFFGDAFARMLVNTLIIGLLFLLPLVLKTIRTAFVPSLFFYFTGMLIMTKSLFACLGQALRISIGGETITYGLIAVTSSTNSVSLIATEVMAASLPIIILLFFVFLKLGQRLWHVHYKDSEIGMKWLYLTLALFYWGSLIFNVVVV